MKINLGSVALDVSDIASQGNAILGIRDSGKTWAAILIAEKLMTAGVPIIAFDPIGRWRHLGTPGAGKGFPIVVAGGEHGDLPLTPASAPEIVRAAMRERVSLVLDLYSMELSKADWRRIVASAVQTLLYENKAHGLRHLFIEEAAEFCPQIVSPDAGKVYDQIERLARMGGNALLGYTLINQRSEQVNKAVLELCDNLLLFRQKGKNSLTSLSKWLDIGSASQGKEIIASLPTLLQGTCWVWAAGTDHPVKVKMPGIQTFSPDRRAQHASGGVMPARVDVGKFVEGMKGALEKVIAEAAANDPKTLRAEIAKLKREAGQHVASDADKEQAWTDGYATGRAEGTEEGKRIGEAEGKAVGWNMACIEAEAALAELRRNVPDRGAEQVLTPSGRGAKLNIGSPGPRIPVRYAPKPTPNMPRNIPRATGPGVSLTKAERAILTALAQYHPHGRTKGQIAILTGYAGSGGGFRNAISSNRVAGRLEGDDPLRITDQGLADLGAFTPLPHGDALLQHWLAQLSKAERACLESIVGAYPSAMTKEAVAASTGYEADGGGFRNALSRLRVLELIEGRGEVRASDHLFG